MSTFGSYNGTIRNTIGEAISGASIAILTQPATTTSQPGSPLATIYAASTSNTESVSGAAWLAGTATLTLGSVSSDMVVGSYISISSVVPAGYNGIAQLTAVAGLTVSYALTTNPGAYVSGGSVASSALPNPFLTDNLGNFAFYATPGQYTVQAYGVGLANQLVLADQNAVLGGGAGSVTSIGLTLPAQFTVTGSPVTSNGTIAATWTNEDANYVLAGPSSGSADTPSFRALVAADFPAGVGTVTSVAHTLSVPSALLSASVAGSPVTSTGTFADTVTLVNQSANTILCGPTSGGSTTPTFRTLVETDISQAVATVALTSANILALDGTPVTLIAAQGSGTTIVPLMVMITFSGGSSAYTDAGGAVSVSVGSMSTALSDNTLFTSGATSGQEQVQVINFTGKSSAASTPDCSNAALTISKITHNFAAGNGTAKIKIHYLVLATN